MHINTKRWSTAGVLIITAGVIAVLTHLAKNKKKYIT
jgi:hypothetical protein